MRGAAFVQHTKITNVAGRIGYISSEEKQENLYAVYDTAPEGFWQDLARENQMAFMRSGTEGKCIEARELIIALPKEMYRYGEGHMELLKDFTEGFKEKYGVECIAALHHNKTRSNYHIHLIFSERRVLAEPEVKIASRNMYYDPHGKHLRTAKETKDEKGNLLPGYTVIPKGEVYERQIFDKKDEYFKSKDFTQDVKEYFVDRINENLVGRNKMFVFPKDGPYIPTKKIGKNNPKANEIQKMNEIKDEWNRQMIYARMYQVPYESLKEVKQELIINPMKESMRRSEKKNDPESFKEILLKATKTLIVMVKETKRMRDKDFDHAWGDALKDFIKACAEIAKDVIIRIGERGIER
ncbi:MAG: MobA/MobL family protein [Firmicutes bacterium]|nr:MobA/MobL family protein [Bacillota bacterium]